MVYFSWPEKHYSNEFDNPRRWKNKLLYKWWKSLPMIPSLTSDEWDNLIYKCSAINKLVEKLNNVPPPKSWYGGWGFTGTAFFKRGFDGKDVPSIVEGLRWFDDELNEIPPNVVILKDKEPDSFNNLKKLVKDLIKFINDNNYWKISSKYSFRSKIKMWAIKSTVHVVIFCSKTRAIIFPLIKELFVFVFIYIMLYVFVYIFLYICNRFDLILLDNPTTGELLLVSAAIMGLRKGYDAVNTISKLISKITIKKEEPDNSVNKSTYIRKR